MEKLIGLKRVNLQCVFFFSDDLFVKRTGIFLWANEVWGALRGLETFSQLVFKGPDSQVGLKGPAHVCLFGA